MQSGTIPNQERESTLRKPAEAKDSSMSNSTGVVDLMLDSQYKLARGEESFIVKIL